MSERVIHDLEVIEIDEEHGKGVFRVPARPLTGVTQSLDETRHIRQSGQPIVQGVVTKLTLDPLRFDGSTLQLDLADCRRGDFGEVLYLIAVPIARCGIDGNDQGDGLAGGASDTDAEESSDA